MGGRTCCKARSTLCPSGLKHARRSRAALWLAQADREGAKQAPPPPRNIQHTCSGDNRLLGLKTSSFFNRSAAAALARGKMSCKEENVQTERGWGHRKGRSATEESHSQATQHDISAADMPICPPTSCIPSPKS
eukprot:364915-Chlamydomonas_euryale.AAC.33